MPQMFHFGCHHFGLHDPWRRGTLGAGEEGGRAMLGTVSITSTKLPANASAGLLAWLARSICNSC